MEAPSTPGEALSTGETTNLPTHAWASNQELGDPQVWKIPHVWLGGFPILPRLPHRPGRSQHHFLEGDTGSGSEVLEFTTGSGPLNNGKRSLTEEPRPSGSDAHSSNYRHRIQERIAPGSTPALLLQRAPDFWQVIPLAEPRFPLFKKGL